MFWLSAAEGSGAGGVGGILLAILASRLLCSSRRRRNSTKFPSVSSPSSTSPPSSSTASASTDSSLRQQQQQQQGPSMLRAALLGLVPFPMLKLYALAIVLEGLILGLLCFFTLAGKGDDDEMLGLAFGVFVGSCSAVAHGFVGWILVSGFAFGCFCATYVLRPQDIAQPISLKPPLLHRSSG